MMEYTFSILKTIEAEDEDSATATLMEMIDIPEDFVVELTGKYDPETDQSWHYSDYYGWELV